MRVLIELSWAKKYNSVFFCPAQNYNSTNVLNFGKHSLMSWYPFFSDKTPPFKSE